MHEPTKTRSNTLPTTPPPTIPQIVLDRDVNDDSNLDLIVAIIELSTAVFVGYLPTPLHRQSAKN